MANIITGDGMAILTFDNGLWKPYACAADYTLTLSTQMIETSEPGSGMFATFRPQKHSFTGQVNGVVRLGEANKLALSDLQAKQIAGEVLLMRFQKTAIDGVSVYTQEAYFYITASEEQGSYADVVRFGISLQGTGSLSQVFTPSPQTASAVNRYDDYTPIQDATTFTVGALANKDILEVVKDGVGFGIITAGTPLGKQVKYTASTGTFEFGIPFEGDEEPPYIIYQDL